MPWRGVGWRAGRQPGTQVAGSQVGRPFLGVLRVPDEWQRQMASSWSLTAHGMGAATAASPRHASRVERTRCSLALPATALRAGLAARERAG